MDGDGSRKKPVKRAAKKKIDNSFVQSLKTDWEMFWHGLVGEEVPVEKQDDAFVTGRLEALSIDQVRELTKVLSQDRKKLNQRLESVQREIDEHSQKLESLRLVGSDDQSTVERLNQLSDLGQSVNAELGKLNDKLKLARRREDSIRKGAAV